MKGNYPNRRTIAKRLCPYTDDLSLRSKWCEGFSQGLKGYRIERNKGDIYADGHVIGARYRKEFPPKPERTPLVIIDEWGDDEGDDEAVPPGYYYCDTCDAYVEGIPIGEGDILCERCSEICFSYK